MGADTGVGLTAAEFFGIAVGALSPLVPIQLLQWTPNYSGAGFVQITEWEPDNNFEITVVFYRDQTAVDSDIWGHRTQNNKLIYQQSTNTIRLRPNPGGALLELSGILGGLNFLRLSKTGTDIVADLNGSETTIPNVSFSEINVFGASNGVLEWDGQIHTIRLTDLDNPANSRFYRSIIDSVTLPDSLVLRDELGTPVNQNLDDDLTTWTQTSGATVTSPTSFIVSSTNAGIAEAVGENGRFYRITVDRNVPIDIQIRTGSSPQGGNPLLGVIPAGTGVFSTTYLQVPPVIVPNADPGIYLRTSTGTDQEIIFNSIVVEEVTDGILTDFPAAQRWVPVLMTNQAYFSNRSDSGWVRGVRTGINGLTSEPGSSEISGSLLESSVTVGSLLRSGSVFVQLTEIISGRDEFRYAIASGTNAQIQAAFEYPNVFDIDPFDSATEGYNGNRSSGDWNNGVNLVESAPSVSLSSFGEAGGVFGSYSGNIPQRGTIVTASNGASLFVLGAAGSSTQTMELSVITGTDEEIQAGFQWPNHFSVDPFDSATEAYAGTITGGTWLRGVDVSRGRINSNGSGGFEGAIVQGSWGLSPPSVGSILTAQNGVICVVISSQADFVEYTSTGTPEQIQAGFQWPNHFTVTPP